jgi:hypothetical protein
VNELLVGNYRRVLNDEFLAQAFWVLKLSYKLEKHNVLNGENLVIVKVSMQKSCTFWKATYEIPPVFYNYLLSRTKTTLQDVPKL